MNKTGLKALALFTVAGLLGGCSGMGTTMTKVGRMGQNRGYEIPAELPAVQSAALGVLRARGYETSLKADPENGAEGAGQIVIGQKVAKYTAGADSSASAPTHLDTRDLVDIYISKKWQMGSNLGVPNITLVDIVGGSYIRRAPGAVEEETLLSSGQITVLRDEIERAVSAAHAAAK